MLLATNATRLHLVNFPMKSYFLLNLQSFFQDDLKLWLPDAETPPTDLDLETSRFLLKQVGDHFCDLLVQEKDAFDEHMSDGNNNNKKLARFPS